MPNKLSFTHEIFVKVAEIQWKIRSCVLSLDATGLQKCVCMYVCACRALELFSISDF